MRYYRGKFSSQAVEQIPHPYAFITQSYFLVMKYDNGTKLEI